MAARADRLGDRGPSAPSNWEPARHRRGARAGHGLGGRRRASRGRAGVGHRRGRRACARSTLVHLQQAEALAGGRDHFGFFDGIAQPAIEGSGVAPRPGDGQPDGAGGWREVATGEVLLGYRDEDGALPAAPGARRSSATARSSSTASWRWTPPRSAASSPPRRLPGRRRPARGQDRRPLARRHAARALPRPPGRRRSPSPADQRLLLRGRPGRPALPARRPHPPREPARQPRLLRRPALQPPPDRPPRPRLRPAAAAGRARRRRRRPRPDLRLLPGRHLAPVRDHPGALDRRRRPVRPRRATRTS